MTDPGFDCAIVGGGVAGLALSVLLARQNKKVVLFEKEHYPFHKVCGEYLSNESLPFLKSIGLDLTPYHLPVIGRLFLTSSSGTAIERPLDIGGTGISRYQLDLQLSKLALEAGVDLRTGTRVQHIDLLQDHCMVRTQEHGIRCRLAAGAYGKGSNMDVSLGGKYRAASKGGLFVAVKQHIYLDTYDPSRVEMHAFDGGYCGISAIEDGKINFSYITKASNLRKHGNIAAMEKAVLCRNPFLKQYFEKARFIFQKPLTISHLQFTMKQPVRQGIFMLGDAAGNIAPLSGNGMSIAFQSALLASETIIKLLDGTLSRADAEKKYSADCLDAFNQRISTARQINWLLQHSLLNNMAFKVFRLFPWLIDNMGKKIHGESF